MDDRTVIEWDKDDLEALDLLKVDVLGLGMLSCLRRAFDMLETHYDEVRHLAIQDEDEATYNMIQRADTIGVFQIESRAQMSMLPRLASRGILRPRHRGRDRAAGADPGRHGASLSAPPAGPRSRSTSRRLRPARPADELEQVLQQTLGVPLFQEQAMRIAIVAAGSRRPRPTSCAAPWRRSSASARSSTFATSSSTAWWRAAIVREFAERCFSQIEGFGEYGFPESHAASFANLVYASAWIKCRYPDVFAAALLNSQPMGFYAPAQIVRDAQEHGVEVRPVDVNASCWDCTLEPWQ